MELWGTWQNLHPPEASGPCTHFFVHVDIMAPEAEFLDRLDKGIGPAHVTAAALL